MRPRHSGKLSVQNLRRGSIAVEAVLLLPVLLLLFAVISQFMIFSKTRSAAEQAAYSAARSALAYKCPPSYGAGVITSPGTAPADAACRDTPEAWKDAAAWALMSSAPSDGQGSDPRLCKSVPAVARALVASGMAPELVEATQNRMCYIHMPDTLNVSVEWVTGPSPDAGAPDFRAIRATVEFKFPVITPIGRLFSDGEHDDGLPWTWGAATMVVS
ncbi:MAG: TadE/TadG family type IV pilus assembly protein [Hyphomonas sp.]|uniref:TadE/TadG family type IV pilus assembly protein n=1 Tax=Hyphomonas sp. TaxID=87 RepID=UPI003297154E